MHPFGSGSCVNAFTLSIMRPLRCLLKAGFLRAQAKEAQSSLASRITLFRSMLFSPFLMRPLAQSDVLRLNNVGYVLDLVLQNRSPVCIIYKDEHRQKGLRLNLEDLETRLELHKQVDGIIIRMSA